MYYTLSSDIYILSQDTLLRQMKHASFDQILIDKFHTDILEIQNMTKKIVVEIEESCKKQKKQWKLGTLD